MNVLIIDHFFSQDINALRRAAAGRHVVKTINPWYFVIPFGSIFPTDVQSNNFALFYSDRFERERRHWLARTQQLMHDLYRIFPYDLVLAPSDTYPWIRSVPEVVHQMGMPFIVVQKETALSDLGLEVESRAICRHFPFISDYMTTCSDRQRHFWINGGADPALLQVTGQPRFDFYCQPQLWPKWAEIGVPLDPSRKTILFFTYMLEAYLPIERVASGELSWRGLREETEDVLLRLSENMGYNLVVKPHPQQDPVDLHHIASRLKRTAPSLWKKRVFLLPRTLDARHLLVNADVIVAFQTTALLEALILGKQVIYTHWTREAEIVEHLILPYHKHPEVITCVRNAAELEAAVCAPSRPLTNQERKQRAALFEAFLGPCDGQTSQRVWAAIEEVHQRIAIGFSGQVKDAARQLRERLTAEGTAFMSEQRWLALWYWLTNLCWAVVLSPLLLSTRFRGKWRLVLASAGQQRQRLHELSDVAAGRLPGGTELVGSVNHRWWSRLVGSSADSVSR